MKITAAEIILAHRSNRDGIPSWTPCWVRLLTDEGIDGIGEIGLAYGVASSGGPGVAKDLIEAFVFGQDPFDIESIWESMFRNSFWGEGGGPVITGAMSAIDAALWDIKGKALNTPVWKLLGGKTNENLRTYASQIQFGWSERDAVNLVAPDAYGDAARAAVAEGYDCIKVDPLMIGRDGARDFGLRGMFSLEDLKFYRARMEAIRDAVGSTVDIILELHSFTSKSGAHQLIDLFSDLDIFLVEEPTNYANPLAHQALHDRIGLRLTAGERFYTRWGAAPYLSRNTVDMVQPDFGLIGGITEGKKVCDLAHLYDITVQGHVCGSPVATAIALQIETVIPNFQIHEHHIYARKQVNRELCDVDLQPVKGRFEAPEGAGLGLRLTDKAYHNADLITLRAS